MADCKKDGQYLFDVKINGVELQCDEVKYIQTDFFLGNIMSKLKLVIQSDRVKVHQISILEMSIIEITMGLVSDKGELVDKKKMRYFLSKVEMVEDYHSKHGNKAITIIGVADAYKYLGYPDIRSAKGRLTVSPKFIQEMNTSIGSNSKKSGKIKAIFKDGLMGNVKDFTNFLQYELTGIETVNVVSLRNVLKTSKYSKSEKNQRIYSSAIDFDPDGSPVINFMDIRLRTQTFSAKNIKTVVDTDVVTLPAHFTFDEKKDWVRYSRAELDLKGADYTELYWQRASFNFDIEENVHWYNRIRQLKLFPDSAEYAKQDIIPEDTSKREDNDLSEFSMPDDMPTFTSFQRVAHEFYTTNVYNKFYADQKFQTTATLLGLRKINVNMSFNRQFIKILPGDICKVEISKRLKDQVLTINPKFSSRYMVTRTSFVYKDNMIATYVTASRDSFVK
jgi:hypothetical protein